MDKIINKIIGGDHIITLPWNPIYKRMTMTIGMTNGFVKEKGVSSLMVCNQPAAAVFWQEGMITTVKTTTNTNIFSFEFGGCAMARYRIKGQVYAAHIHSSNDYKVDCRDKWIDYIRQQSIIPLRIFRPDYFEDADDSWGLISEEGNCYSIGVKEIDNNDAQHYPVSFEVIHIHQHWVGTSVYDYTPILKHGMELQLRYLQVSDYLKRRHCVTRSQWENFWEKKKSQDLFRLIYL